MSGTATIQQRRDIRPVGHPRLIATHGPLILPHDTRNQFDREIAKLRAQRNRRPDVVITKQFLRIGRWPEQARDVGRFIDRAAYNRRPIIAESQARASQFGVRIDRRPEHVR